MKEVSNPNLWNFKLVSLENMNVPIWIIIGFRQRDVQDSQNLKNDSFCRLPVTSAQCNIWTENYPDTGISLSYNGDNYSQGYTQTKEVFEALTKDDILQPYLTDDDFRSSFAGVVEVGYMLFVLDINFSKTSQLLNLLK